jgi:N-acetylmuramoyl-L-alanine amidase
MSTIPSCIYCLRGGVKIAVIKTNDAQTAMPARLMRSEAEVEGNLGVPMVGNVGVNRVRADCLDFTDVRTNLREIVRHNGMVSRTREDSKYIVSSRQPKKIVLKSKRKKVDNL